MFQAFMAAYPWDLWDEGVDDVLGRLQGEVGVTGLSVWAVVPSLTQLRVRDAKPRVFRTRGGVCFQPVEGRYGSTRCKPVVADWLRGRDVLARIAERCSQREMSFRLLVSASAAGRAARQRPQFACKNALDDASTVSLCLANADVQAYLEGLTADLSEQYQPAGVLLADYVCAWGDAYVEPLRVGGTPLSDALRALLSICFCESCLQKAGAAGVDTRSALEVVRSAIMRHLDGPASDGRGDHAPAAEQEPLAAYLRWRGEELSALLRRFATLGGSELVLRTEPTPPSSIQHAVLVSAIPDTVSVQFASTDALEAGVGLSAKGVEWYAPETLMREADGSGLVSLTARAVELGYKRIEFGNYGHLPADALAAVSRAVRYARRS